MKISVEKISAQKVRVILIAEIQVSGNLDLLAHDKDVEATTGPATESFAPAADGSADERELLTVEEAARILHVGRDKVYYLIRSRQLRSIKIGKLRRISRTWIEEFIGQ